MIRRCHLCNRDSLRPKYWWWKYKNSRLCVARKEERNFAGDEVLIYVSDKYKFCRRLDFKHDQLEPTPYHLLPSMTPFKSKIQEKQTLSMNSLINLDDQNIDTPEFTCRTKTKLGHVIITPTKLKTILKILKLGN